MRNINLIWMAFTLFFLPSYSSAEEVTEFFTESYNIQTPEQSAINVTKTKTLNEKGQVEMFLRELALVKGAAEKLTNGYEDFNGLSWELIKESKLVPLTRDYVPIDSGGNKISFFNPVSVRSDYRFREYFKITYKNIPFDICVGVVSQVVDYFERVLINNKSIIHSTELNDINTQCTDNSILSFESSKADNVEITNLKIVTKELLNNLKAHKTITEEPAMKNVNPWGKFSAIPTSKGDPYKYQLIYDNVPLSACLSLSLWVAPRFSEVEINGTKLKGNPKDMCSDKSAMIFKGVNNLKQKEFAARMTMPHLTSIRSGIYRYHLIYKSLEAINNEKLLHSVKLPNYYENFEPGKSPLESPWGRIVIAGSDVNKNTDHNTARAYYRITYFNLPNSICEKMIGESGRVFASISVNNQLVLPNNYHSACSSAQTNGNRNANRVDFVGMMR